MIGTILGHYRIIDQICEGGMGEVHRPGGGRPHPHTMPCQDLSIRHHR